jgi:hypothetical protein
MMTTTPHVLSHLILLSRLLFSLLLLGTRYIIPLSLLSFTRILITGRVIISNRRRRLANRMTSQRHTTAVK